MRGAAPGAAAGAWLARRPGRAFAASLLLLGALAAGLPWVTIDTSRESNFVKGDPSLDVYHRFLETFGSDEVIYVLVECPAPFEEPHLGRLLALGEALEELPFVVRLRSPLHSPYAVSVDDVLHVRAVADDPPADATGRRRARERVLGYAPFQGLLIDAAGRRVGFLLQLESHPGDRGFRERAVAEVDRVRADGPWAEYPQASVGMPYNVTHFARLLMREMRGALASGLAVAALLLLALFRSPRAVAAPFAVIAAGLVGTFGLSGLLGIPLGIPSSILVTLVICVGVADATHVLSACQRRLATGAPWEEAFQAALGEVWTPCLLTSATTALGFSALLTSRLAPIRNMGFLAAVSCLLALVFTLGLLPLLLRGWRPPPTVGGRGVTGAAVGGLLRLTGARPGRVLAVTAVVFAAAVAGVHRVQVNDDFLHNLPPESRLRRDLEFVQERMGGPVNVEVLIDAGRPGGAVSAELIAEVHAFEEWLRDAHPMVRKVESVADDLAVAQGLFLDEEPRPPRSDAAVAQLLEVAVPADRTERFVSADRRWLRVAVRCQQRGSREYARVLPRIEAELQDRFSSWGGGTLTGGAVLLARMNEYVLETQVESFALALALVMLLVAVRAGEVRLATVSLLANALPVLAVLGVMGWAGIGLQMTNVLVAAVAIGIVVDDTIHFSHGFRRETDAGYEPREALERVLQRAGRAILFTSLVLVLSFLSYQLSAMRSVREFGLLAAGTFAAALVTDLVLVPCVLLLWPRRSG